MNSKTNLRMPLTSETSFAELLRKKFLYSFPQALWNILLWFKYWILLKWQLSSKEQLSGWACWGSVTPVLVPDLFPSFYWASLVYHFGVMPYAQEETGDNDKTSHITVRWCTFLQLTTVARWHQDFLPIHFLKSCFSPRSCNDTLKGV